MIYSLSLNCKIRFKIIAGFGIDFQFVNCLNRGFRGLRDFADCAVCVGTFNLGWFD